MAVTPLNYIWERCRVGERFELPSRPGIDNLEVALPQIHGCLANEVKRLVAGTTEVGLTLSGGVDSTSIGVLARAAGVRVKSYTVGTPYGAEYQAARESASVIGSEHQELTMTRHDLATLLPELVRCMEMWDPMTLQIAAPTAFLYAEAGALKTPKVFLTGYGADLVFGGVAQSGPSERALERAILKQVELTVLTNDLVERDGGDGYPPLKARAKSPPTC